MEITKKHCIIILILGLYVFFIGNASIFITDPVEANYTLTAKEMLQAGNYMSPQIYGEYWYDKPIFFYWELIAAFKIFGISEFAARFFSAVFGIIGLFMTYGFARKLYDAKTALLSSLILGTSFEYWLIAKAVITDMTFFVFFDAVLIFFYLAYTSQRKGYYYGCYFFAGLAVLTKGPIGILLPGLVIVLFLLSCGKLFSIRQMKILPGMLIFLLVGGSWYWIMYNLHGQDFLMVFLGVHNVLRATVSEHPNYNVWYYYTAIFFIGFFPWSFSIPLVLRRYWEKREWPVADMTTRFLLIWAITIAVFYQCMATKYTTYTFPYLLPIAILTTRGLLNHTRAIKRIVMLNIAFYTALTFLVAVPYCQKYSAKDAAVAIVAQASPEETIISYGDYKTSAVFYSDHLIYRLEKAADIENLKPKAMSWSNKNVMPFLSEEEASQKNELLAVVDVNKVTAFKQNMPGEWQLVKSFDTLQVFKKKPAR